MTIDKNELEELEAYLEIKTVDYVLNNTIHFTDSSSLTFSSTGHSYYTFNDPEL